MSSPQAGAVGPVPAGNPGMGAHRAASVSAPPSVPAAHPSVAHAPAAHGPAAARGGEHSASRLDGGPSGGGATTRRVKGQRRPPRLASLQLKRVDPWTVLKISLIVAIVMFFVWMIAVGTLYLALGSLDVWTKLNSTWVALTSADANGNASDLVTPGGVFAVTAVIGAINIVLFTALATIAAFVYNAAAGMAGGVEVTLGERD